MMMTPNLSGKIAVVTGASRGVGRGIAQVLGEAGATVYVTGRSVRGAATTENLPGTIDETAELVTAMGGTGIPVRCDHTVDAEVAALFERVRQEHGRLDLLVNNVWGGYEHYDTHKFDGPFWEQPWWYWEGMFVAGVRAHYLASRFAASLMLPHRRGLIINISSGDGQKYRGNLLYDVAKTAVDRLAAGIAHELRSSTIAALSLYPGFVRTERVMAVHAAHPFDLSQTETPEYTGRAVAALAGDPDVMRWSGSVVKVGELARVYGFTDRDGTQPPPFTFEEPGSLA
ncbi:MAG: SDR family NAD(P)-dependent oxidoreductase [Chloroflexaceae bacterium]|nr:SDR family NAD(P)-dependent oxidoreductase [Chloroflexaceae bacterium]